ncbi:hypothetical protein JXA40_05305 [bacterium]|nr:hypothetical protein [candidate division CSSED10-310 bacterium]
MATVTFEIVNYQIQLGYEIKGAGGSDKSRGCLACFGESRYKFFIYFSPPGSPLEPPRFSPDSKYGSINVDINEMANYVDLVRNEKPVYASLDSINPELNKLMTSLEPIGEGEE